MKQQVSRSRPELFSILDEISEYYPDLAPRMQDSDEDLACKYFYWVDEHNDGYDPRNIARPASFNENR